MAKVSRLQRQKFESHCGSEMEDKRCHQTLLFRTYFFHFLNLRLNDTVYSAICILLSLPSFPCIVHFSLTICSVTVSQTPASRRSLGPSAEPNQKPQTTPVSVEQRLPPCPESLPVAPLIGFVTSFSPPRPQSTIPDLSLPQLGPCGLSLLCYFLPCTTLWVLY